MKTTERVIKSLLKHARPEILKEFRPDSCIASTAVGIDVLTRFGVLAEPLPVRMMAFNAAFANRIEAGSPWPTNGEILRWAEEDGSYSVGIGLGEQQPNKWAGHLVVLAEKQWLIDLSIDQASRPQYKMVFDPLCIEVDAGFLAGEPKVFRYDGCVLRFDCLKDNHGYATAPDWIFENRRKKIVSQTINFIKGEL